MDYIFPVAQALAHCIPCIFDSEDVKDVSNLMSETSFTKQIFCNAINIHTYDGLLHKIYL